VPPNERGVVLLEVIAAVAILATVGFAMLALVTAGLRAHAVAQTRERELWDEERLLAAYTLLTRTELDQRLGSRDAGRYVVQVQRPEPALYRIAVSRTSASAVEDLVTVVYRAERR